MVRVRLTKKLGQHETGSEHDVSDATARRLIRKGDAEKIGAKKPTRSRSQLEPRRRAAKGQKDGATPSGGIAKARNISGADEPLTGQQQ